MDKPTFTAEPGKQEVTLTCLLEATRERVFKALTDPALVSSWWGPETLATFVQRMDVCPGGQWRFVQHDPAGQEYTFHGVYHAVAPPERLVYTFEYEGTPGHVLLETITLEARGLRTLLTDHSVFQSLADRDGMLRAGMESGAVESMERLNALLCTA